MIILGINETSHDASVSLIENDQILFAGHAERYSKKKNDWYVNKNLINNAFQYGKPDKIAYYEKPYLKKSRLLFGGSSDWRPKFDIEHIPRVSFKHHYSHASAGYFTSKFDDAAIVVIDAIGEWNTSTIWTGEGNKIIQRYSLNYPISFGLFYSAFTKLVGLKPNEEEYIFMGMAAYGDSNKYFKEINDYFPVFDRQKYNFHRGIDDWKHIILEKDRFDIAAAVQRVYENRLFEFMVYAKKITNKNNLVFMGGCALNCSANTQLWSLFDDIWIMPNPGDAGSSLGAAAALYQNHLNWQGPYLGYDLGSKYPVLEIVEKLNKNKIVAVATGRAEYGPRALGNRSILADPREVSIKDEVNKIKKRELFRPFAPVVMEEHASQWFDMDFFSPYMQYTVKCLKPKQIPAVVHVDGTSRVQTVNRHQHPGLWRVLNKFYLETGVPVLLNTSLNIKGQPLLNNEHDIIEWEKTYKFPICK